MSPSVAFPFSIVTTKSSPTSTFRMAFESMLYSDGETVRPIALEKNRKFANGVQEKKLLEPASVIGVGTALIPIAEA